MPLFAGLLPVLVDDRRRGLHDLIAGTIVLYSEEEPPAEPLPARTTVRSDPPTRGRLPRALSSRRMITPAGDAGRHARCQH